MKKIFLLLLIMTSTSISTIHAQGTRPPYFDTCQYLQPLQGEWMNVNGNDTIRIYLRYHRNFESDPETFNSTIDELWGWVEYKQGNNVLVSDYSNRFASLPYNVDDVTTGLRSIVLSAGIGGYRMVAVGYNPCTNPIINLGGFFIDRVRCNTDKHIMATVNSQGTQMIWQLEQQTAWLDSAWCGGFTLPEYFTLTKQ